MGVERRFKRKVVLIGSYHRAWAISDLRVQSIRRVTFLIEEMV